MDHNLKGKQKESKGRSSRAKGNETKVGGQPRKAKYRASGSLSLAACKLETKGDEHTQRNGLPTERPAAPLASWSGLQCSYRLIAATRLANPLSSIYCIILSLYKESNCLASQYICNIEPKLIKYLLLLCQH